MCTITPHPFIRLLSIKPIIQCVFFQIFLANETEVQFLICSTRAVHSAGRQVGRDKLFKYQNGSGMDYSKTSMYYKM